MPAAAAGASFAVSTVGKGLSSASAATAASGSSIPTHSAPRSKRFWISMDVDFAIEAGTRNAGGQKGGAAQFSGAARAQPASGPATVHLAQVCYSGSDSERETM